MFDETSFYVLPELLRMYETIRRNLAKRKAAEPWSLETSTMFAIGRECVAELPPLRLSIAEGRATDPGFLFDHRQAPDLDFHDPMLRAEHYRGYGDAAAGWTWTG